MWRSSRVILKFFVIPAALIIILKMSGVLDDEAPRRVAKNTPVQTPAAADEVGLEDEYPSRLEAQADLIASMKADSFTSSMEMIGFGLGIFRAAAQVADEGRGLDLTGDLEAKRKALIKDISRRQVDVLPALRDALGPILRKQLWINDGSARTIGSGFRTIEFVQAAFAANKNIQAAQEEMHGLLMEMRFTRANYRWYEGAQKFSYYSMEPPADGDVVIWTGTGRWRVVE